MTRSYGAAARPAEGIFGSHELERARGELERALDPGHVLAAYTLGIARKRRATRRAWQRSRPPAADCLAEDQPPLWHDVSAALFAAELAARRARFESPR